MYPILTGRLDLLFNVISLQFLPRTLAHFHSPQNAGMNAPKANFEDVRLQDWNDIIAVNVTAPYLASQHAFRIMRDQVPQGGR